MEQAAGALLMKMNRGDDRPRDPIGAKSSPALGVYSRINHEDWPTIKVEKSGDEEGERGRFTFAQDGRRNS